MATRTTTAPVAAPDRANGYPTDAELEALNEIYPHNEDAYLPGEEPMPESFPHSLKLIDFVSLVKRALKDVDGVTIGSDVNLYYREGTPSAVLAPDVMIIFHEQSDRVVAGNSYFLWAWGKPPEFVMEFASHLTARRDLGVKRDVYASIGILEYWMYDPHGTDYYGFRLRGERLVNGAYEPIPMLETEDGWLCAHSEVLGYDICWTGAELRLRDPSTGSLLPTYDENEAQLEAERRRADAAEEELARIREKFGI